MKLVKEVKGRGEADQGGREVPAVPLILRGGGRAYGLEIDGAVYPLDQQPPLATTKGWGDLSFLKR